MPLEIRQLTVKSVVQSQAGEEPRVDQGRELRLFREEILEECRRLITGTKKAEEER